MAIIEHKTSDSKNSLNKQIDESSAFLIYEVLQGSMYKYPMYSAVREAVSNNIDSIKEKNIAKEILSGKFSIEEYYTSNGDSSTVDSNFDSEYYDLNYLSDNDTISINYNMSNDPSGRDSVSFIDHGVGLGGKRLIGWTKLGYSTKRLSKKLLGGFGLGCKSPLATEIDSFRLHSRHNGKEYCLDVYNDRIISVFGKMNEDGSKNEYLPVTKKVTQSDGSVIDEIIFKMYYKNTSEKNMVEVNFDVKRHNRNEFMNAVKQQLMYIREDVVLTIDDENNRKYNEKIKSSIIYEDDNIVVADDSYYSKPHFIINNVVYGIVDFKELELPERNVNVGIKVSMEEVDVSPSRESIRYTSKTKETVINKFKEIEKLVTDKLSSQLKVDDFFEWQNSVYSICSSSNSSSNDVVVNRLGKLIDRNSLDFKFNKIPGNISISNFYGNFIKVVKINQNYSSKTRKYTFAITDQDYIKMTDLNKIVIYEDNLSSGLKSFFYKNSYTALTQNKNENNENYFKILENEELTLEEKEEQCIEILEEERPDLFTVGAKNPKLIELKRSIRVHHYIMASPHLKTLDDFDIENVADDDENEDGDVKVKKAPKIKQKANRAKLNVSVLGGKDMKIDKQDVAKYNFCYFLTGDVNSSAALTKLKIHQHAGLVKGDNVSDVFGYTLNGKIIIGIANGNERYVEKHWTKIDFDIYKLTLIDDNNYEIKFNDDILNYMNTRYSNIMIHPLIKSEIYSFKIKSIINTLEKFKIDTDLFKFDNDDDNTFTDNVGMSDFKVNDNVREDVIYNILRNSKNSINNSYAYNLLSTIISNKLISINDLTDIKIIKHNLNYNCPVSLEKIQKICLLQANQFDELLEIPEEIVNKYASEFNPFINKIFNNITNLKES